MSVHGAFFSMLRTATSFQLATSPHLFNPPPIALLFFCISSSMSQDNPLLFYVIYRRHGSFFLIAFLDYEYLAPHLRPTERGSVVAGEEEIVDGK
jgi:hypothetical protein